MIPGVTAESDSGNDSGNASKCDLKNDPKKDPNRAPTLCRPSGHHNSTITGNDDVIKLMGILSE